jgi:hypothetical protein
VTLACIVNPVDRLVAAEPQYALPSGDMIEME